MEHMKGVFALNTDSCDELYDVIFNRTFELIVELIEHG